MCVMVFLLYLGVFCLLNFRGLQCWFACLILQMGGLYSDFYGWFWGVMFGFHFVMWVCGFRGVGVGSWCMSFGVL